MGRLEDRKKKTKQTITKKKKQTQAGVRDQHVTFLSSLEHIQSHQKRGASQPVGGPQWGLALQWRKGVQKTWGGDREI